VTLASKVEAAAGRGFSKLGEKLTARTEARAAAKIAADKATVKKTKAAKAKAAKPVIPTGATKSSKKEIAAHQKKRRAISGMK
jgi:hypothetical protein